MRDTVEFLACGLSEWGIALTAVQERQFETYAAMLLEWNSTRMNLTRLIEPSQIGIGHFLDSLAITQVVEMKLDARLADIGCGAGFPALPIKILYPEMSVLLVESTGKKLAFCQAVVDALALTRVEAIHGRAEEVGVKREYRGKFDLVTARAIARLPVLAGWMAPFLSNGQSRAVAWKGARACEELAEAAPVYRKLGMTCSITWITLPQSGDPPIKHAYVVSKKI
jgi:16S rRNA (guanine527-N7)-methyltransferase